MDEVGLFIVVAIICFFAYQVYEIKTDVRKIRLKTYGAVITEELTEANGMVSRKKPGPLRPPQDWPKPGKVSYWKYAFSLKLDQLYDERQRLAQDVDDALNEGVNSEVLRLKYQLVKDRIAFAGSVGIEFRPFSSEEV